MKKGDFEQLVNEVILALPNSTKAVMKNVGFVIEQEIRQKKSHETSIKKDEILLGLYEGVPKINRGSGYFGVLPDKITIFQRPIEKLVGDDLVKLRDLISDVVWHEVGHHLGFSESGIRALEAKRKHKH